MPVLRLFLLHSWIIGWILFHLKNKANFGGVAEVCDCKETYFLDKRFPIKFELILALFEEVFHAHCLKLHDTSDAKSRGPLSLVQIPEDILHISLLQKRLLGPFITSIVHGHSCLIEVQFTRFLSYGIDRVYLICSGIEFATVTDLSNFVLKGLLWDHPLLNFIENRHKFTSCPLDVGHGLFQEVKRVELAHVVSSTVKRRTFINKIGNRCWSATFEVRHD